MAITATYVSGTSFTVSGDHTGELRPSLRLQALMGVDGTVEATVDTSSYSGGTGLSTCTVLESVLTENLATIKLGYTYADGTGGSSNVPSIVAIASVGEVFPAAGMSAAEVAAAQSLPVPAVGDAKEFLRENAAGDGYESVDLIGTANQLVGANAAGDDLEAKTIQGTANEVTITHGIGTVTVGLDTGIDEANIGFDITAGHEHNGTDSHTIAHSDTTGQTANDHHAQVHAASHTGAGTDEVDGDKLDIDWNPTNYTPDATPAEVDDVDDLAAHLKGIDDEFALKEDTANKGAASGYCGLDVSGLVDGDDLPAASITKKGAVPVLENTGTKVLYDDGSWSVPPGASGGEANTASNLGGGTGIYEQKVAVDLQFNSLNSTQFTETSNVIQLIVAAPGPDYTPPAIKYKDADEITVPEGQYWPLEWRLDGQYKGANYVPWTVAAAFDVDVDLAGNLIGGDVVSSWYSVFMTSASTVKILPMIRVDALDYNVSNALKTTINPANHDDGTTANDSFVSAADVFNTYRLVLLTMGTYHGNVYTIEDSVDGTPDQVIIDGDVSAEIAATEWLQMIPPAGTDCLYLGCIRLDASGNLKYFEKSRHHYTYDSQNDVSGNLGTSFANTDLGAVIPPTAVSFSAGIYVEATGAPTWMMCTLAKTIAGSSQWKQYWNKATGHVMEDPFIPVTAPSISRNMFKQSDGAAGVGKFRVNGYDE